jgi:hypothetical protein
MNKDPDKNILVNLGCGSTFHPRWTNFDCFSSSPHVIPCDIRKGLPLNDSSVQAVYSSHLIEHLRPGDACSVTQEAFRVIAPGGTIRLVTPDLETMVRMYLLKLDAALAGKEGADAEYHWLLLELLDQSVRERRGGDMGRFLASATPGIREFIRSRVGPEVDAYWDDSATTPTLWDKLRTVHPSLLFQHARNLVARAMVRVIAGGEAAKAFDIGLFRRSGEIHFMLYDRYSLARLLTDAGFECVRVCRADDSSIPGFNDFCLDVIDGAVRKPDSLFIEGIKP